MSTTKELLMDVVLAREVCSKLEGELKEAKQKKEIIEGQLIELMDLQDLKSFKVEGLGLVVRKQTLYPSIDKNYQKELLVYIDEELGRSDAIRHTVHSSTLRSIITEELKEGRKVPEFVKLYFKPSLAITK